MKSIKPIKKIRRVLKYLKKNKTINIFELIVSNIYQGLIAFLRADKTTRIGFIVTFFWLPFIITIAIFNKKSS